MKFMYKCIVSMNTSVKLKKKKICKNHGVAIKDVNLGSSSCQFVIWMVMQIRFSLCVTPKKNNIIQFCN